MWPRHISWIFVEADSTLQMRTIKEVIMASLLLSLSKPNGFSNKSISLNSQRCFLYYTDTIYPICRRNVSRMSHRTPTIKKTALIVQSVKDGVEPAFRLARKNQRRLASSHFDPDGQGFSVFWTLLPDDTTPLEALGSRHRSIWRHQQRIRD
jgi:hypothetical protein